MLDCFAWIPRTIRALALLSGFIASANAAIVDIQPGDYVALTPGDYALTGFFYQRSASGPFKAGDRTGSARVKSEVAAVRLNGFREVAGMPWAWSVVPLWSKARLAEGIMPAVFGQDAGGSGDLRLSATLWPVADRERGHYLGLTVAIFEPTGNYSNQRILNIGDNRRKLAIVAGWSSPLTNTLRLELIPELAFYGTNNDYLGSRRRTQDETLALTSYLRWSTALQWEIYAGAQLNSGGESAINNLGQNDVARNTRLMLGVTHILDRDTLVSARYGADTHVENGFRLDNEWQLRIGRRF